jgi:hypothetical protein
MSSAVARLGTEGNGEERQGVERKGRVLKGILAGALSRSRGL